jgi:hypothetical protein
MPSRRTGPGWLMTGTYPPAATGNFDRPTYRRRNVVERCVGWLKENRRLGTRHEKLAVSFTAMAKWAIVRRYFRNSRFVRQNLIQEPDSGIRPRVELDRRGTCPMIPATGGSRATSAEKCSTSAAEFSAFCAPTRPEAGFRQKVWQFGANNRVPKNG